MFMQSVAVEVKLTPGSVTVHSGVWHGVHVINPNPGVLKMGTKLMYTRLTTKLYFELLVTVPWVCVAMNLSASKTFDDCIKLNHIEMLI
jgi:hypothetical protein